MCVYVCMLTHTHRAQHVKNNKKTVFNSVVLQKVTCQSVNEAVVADKQHPWCVFTLIVNVTGGQMCIPAASALIQL